MSVDPTILIVPGLRDHVAEHWQTLLEAKLKSQAIKVRSVPPLEHDKLSREARVAALEENLAAIDGPVIIVAHSAGAIMVAHWAQNATRPIHGALLATPSDMECAMPEPYPTVEQLDSNGWLPMPRTPLPFPSIVAASRNDPLAQLERTKEFAKAWGSRLVDLGEVGHLNPASGFGEWPLAIELIEELK